MLDFPSASGIFMFVRGTPFSFSNLDAEQRQALRSIIPDEALPVPHDGTKPRRNRQAVSSVGSVGSVVASNEERMNAALLTYFREHDFKGVAVTLTFRAARRPAVLTLEAAQGSVRELIKRLNKFSGGRRRRALQVIAVREGGVSPQAAVRLHYHLKIEVPEGMTAENFASKVEHYWTKLSWASPKQNVVKPLSDDGWTSYITKRRSKQSYADGFDWINTHLLPPPIAECSSGA
ncbi:hypothetical protein [Stenotrophomonas sp.]|uniref:hypothetical protein n=1 Tax=Stenotrophomonas sp. TaxID=69392 RepID=UPI0028A82078|nr:hypothetical protein [Stenotrophomonas sp.]